MMMRRMAAVPLSRGLALSSAQRQTQRQARGLSVFRSSALRRETASSSTAPNASNASGAAQAKRDTPVLDFLEQHGGKVALAGLGAAVYLVYTYYLGIEDRKRVEEEAERRAISEPYELLQLRYANNISSAHAHAHTAHENDEESERESEKEHVVSSSSSTDFSFSLFRAIVDEFRDAPLRETTLSYREFVQRAQRVIAAQRTKEEEKSEGETATLLASGYILDRAVHKKLVQHMHAQQLHHGESEAQQRESNAQCFADIDNVLSVDYLLILLAQALPQRHYRQRVRALFETMELVDNSERDLDHTISTLSRETVLHLISLLQESDQLPPEKQPIETGVKHPVKLYRRKTPEDMMLAKEKNLKLESPRQRWSEKEVFELLSSYQICAWGMCYKPSDD